MARSAKRPDLRYRTCPAVRRTPGVNMPTPALAERTIYMDNARSLLRQLDARVDEVAARVHDSMVWKTLCSPDSGIHLVRAVMREIMFEIASYQPLTTRAGFA